MDQRSKIILNIKKFKEEIAPASLLAVSKYSNVDEILFAYEAGQRDFGENRVSELAVKASDLRSRGILDIRWHFIGHLQSNKISKLLEIENLYAIHSVDSLELLQKLISKKIASKVLIFLEVKTSTEIEKQGFTSSEQIAQAIDLLRKQKDDCFQLKGLMTMAPIRVEDQSQAAEVSFRQLYELKKIFAQKGISLSLSMGMSDDYQIALKYQTEWVRIGSKIFK